ncbi:MAG TPA: ABC transporter permease [Candidatus Acidoferrales bacterium]|nr:ABC transporter permease [Candidatus Acidoferrales bacterium]
MFIRLLKESFMRNPRRKLLTGIALVLGMAVATATFTVAVDVGDQLSREFRSLGANLLVTPQADTLPVEIGGVDYRPVDQGAYLSTSDLPKLKTIFWRHNILGFTPFLDVPAEASIAKPGETAKDFQTTLIGTWYKHPVPVEDGSMFVTGASFTHPWWKIRGHWFSDESRDCVIGASLGQKYGIAIGDKLKLTVGARESIATVKGVVATGDSQDNAVLCPLSVVQDLAGKPGEFRQLFVSALTKPADAFSQQDPNKMTPAEFDRWYCSPYITSISRQIQEVLRGTHVETIRRVAETEGRVLSRISLLLWIVTIAALIAATLAVGATSATTAIERRGEVGLMKALGATNFLVGGLFLCEQLLLAFTGGCVGFVLGGGLARELGETVFGVPTSPRLIVLPIILAAAAAVALLGSWIPLYRAAHVPPAPILRGQ